MKPSRAWIHSVRIVLFITFSNLVVLPIGWADESHSFRVMAWNILHGGKEDGKDVGPQRVVDIIRESEADLVAMQETYGSGEFISTALDFHFHPRGTNVSIHSRYPILEDVSVFEEFKCVGAIIETPGKHRVAFYSIWLPYNTEIWEEGTRDVNDVEAMKDACQASCNDLKKILAKIENRLESPKYAGIPIIIAGDFNSMSHLDYIPSSKDQYDGVVLDWPTSGVITDAGFHDSWRELNPEVDRKADRTWTPRFPRQQQDRIDFIYYCGDGLEAKNSFLIDTHKEKFPSDHAALLTDFGLSKPDASTTRLRTVSYNIRHGHGTDDRLDLDRTAALLRNLRPDIVGLQEVDCVVDRSGKIDQAAYLRNQLEMESEFGSFMDYQGGRYGLAILSRHPITKTDVIRLPDGHEPRVALACTIECPSGESVMAINLHFDWVRDDSFRFAQASRLAEFLANVKIPYILLGDFNDVRGSRTLELLSRNTLEAEKPEQDPFTIPSTNPKREIDFIFVAPKSAWNVPWCRVLTARKTSDHRPVMAVVELR